MATLDAKLLEMRLVTKDSTIGGASVFRIAKALKEFNSIPLSEPENLQEKYDSYAREILKGSLNQIIALEIELNIQKRIRKYKEVCEKKAVSVNELPVQNSLKRQINDCDKTISELNATLDALDQRISKRTKQAQALLEAVELLDMPLDEDIGNTSVYLTADLEEEDEKDNQQTGDGDARASRLSFGGALNQSSYDDSEGTSEHVNETDNGKDIM